MLVFDLNDGIKDMTVEKCVEVARRRNLRYVGLRHSSECYGGNTLHNQEKTSDDQCNELCAGSPSEFCGAAQRLQLYNDPTWHDPTLNQLTDITLQYNSSLFDIRGLNGRYESLVDRWDKQQGNKRRWLFGRQSQTITVTELQEGLSQVESQYPQVRALLGLYCVSYPSYFRLTCYREGRRGRRTTLRRCRRQGRATAGPAEPLCRSTNAKQRAAVFSDTTSAS